MRIGLNVAATSSLDDYGGSAFVRYPLWRDQSPIAFNRTVDIERSGIDPLLVFDRASYTPYGWNNGRPRSSMEFWLAKFPAARFLEVGNEPDGTGPSSSKQSRARFRAFLLMARMKWPHATIVSGGLSRISFSYLDGLDDLPIDAVGFHPYAQDADSVKPLIAEIRKHTTKPLWATELGQEYDPSPGAEHQRAEWLSNMLISLSEEGVEVACVYCGKQDQGPHGLVDVDGTPLESWAAFTGAVEALRGK